MNTFFLIEEVEDIILKHSCLSTDIYTAAVLFSSMGFEDGEVLTVNEFLYEGGKLPSNNLLIKGLYNPN